MPRSISFALGACFVSLLFVGCSEPNTYQAPPPPEVTVALPVRSDIVVYIEDTGSTRAFQTVELRARVSGFLEEIHFEEGDIVCPGQLLFTIEQKQFIADVERSTAEVEALEAILENAEADFVRIQRLIKQEVANEQQLIQTQAIRDKAKADVVAAQASLAQAKIDLSYTEIRAPFHGRISETNVDVGNLVGRTDATLLAKIIAYDPIYGYFSINENAFLKIREKRSRNPEDLADGEEPKIPIEMQLQNETGYPHVGFFDYADLDVDMATGTFLIRARFANPDEKLVPGLFVRWRARIEEREDAILVPETALGSDQAGRFVLVVNSENKVERKGVDLGAQQEGFRVINRGLSGDERIVVNGIQRARPGATVAPQETTLEYTPPQPLDLDAALKQAQAEPDHSDCPKVEPDAASPEPRPEPDDSDSPEVKAPSEDSATSEDKPTSDDSGTSDSSSSEN